MSIFSELHGYNLPSFLHIYRAYSEILTKFVTILLL
jgi:hypothetical protein